MQNSVIRYNSSVPSFDRDEFLTPFSSVFDEFFNESFPSLFKGFGDDFFEKGTYPKADVFDGEDKITIEAEVPGLTKEQISVEVDNGVLRLKGTKQDVVDTTSKKIVHKELKRSSFCRSFVIGENVDQSKLDAKFENGVLKISLPKKVPDKKREEIRKIEIK